MMTLFHFLLSADAPVRKFGEWAFSDPSTENKIDDVVPFAACGRRLDDVRGAHNALMSRMASRVMTPKFPLDKSGSTTGFAIPSSS